VSPQRSNRDALLEGALRCLETLPPERVTARAIADASGANLASIAYHFGSKDELVTEAVIAGLDRWLEEVARRLDGLEAPDPEARLRRAHEAIEATRREHEALARTFLAALARAQHDDRVRARLAAGFRRTRPAVAALLGFGDDQAGVDAAGLVLAQFDGLLFQTLLDPELAIEGERMQHAQARLRDALPRP
jgi:AcrR family transcriptional regulator